MHIRQLLWKMLSGTLTGLRLRASDKEIIKLEKFVITGGKPLHGEVTISGAKNAAVGVLPATILAADVCVIENLPDISDVAVSLKILSVLGAQIKMINRNTYEIDTTHLNGTNVPDDLSRQMRASYYFLGALLSRFGKAQVAMPGGCNLGPRPIDQHLKVFSALGAEDSVDYGMITVRAKEMNGAHIFFDKVSVGATMNGMLSAVTYKKQTACCICGGLFLSVSEVFHGRIHLVIFGFLRQQQCGALRAAVSHCGYGQGRAHYLGGAQGAGPCRQ